MQELIILGSQHSKDIKAKHRKQKNNKSHSFSVYLLKDGVTPKEAIDEKHELGDPELAQKIPTGGVFYILDNKLSTPKWVDYFGVTSVITQSSVSAILFLPVNGRWFVFTFGYAYNKLNDIAYEHDFGIRVTLNCIDPNKLKSADVLEPGASRRKRTQIPNFSDLTYFDFDHKSNILKSLTGLVKDQFAEYFKHITGTSNLRIGTNIQAHELPDLCNVLLELYRSDEFKISFPNIQDIEFVREPAVIDKLDKELLSALQSRDDKLWLTVPNMVDYNTSFDYRFSGSGPGIAYSDLCIGNYYEYLDMTGLYIADISTLKSHKLVLVDENGMKRDLHTLYKCLVFDTTLNDGAEAYHFSEGNWYKVEKDFLLCLTV